MSSDTSSQPLATGTTVQPMIWSTGGLRLLDQRRLPQATEWIDCDSAAAVAEAIRSMAVRGAPAIGIAAAFGIVIDAQAGRDYAAAETVLLRSRPTAVNLHWALGRMRGVFDAGGDAGRLEAEAQAILVEDVTQNRRIGEFGAALLPQGARVLTHCNTGALATGGHGTALGIVRSAHAEGRIERVYATETRPWLQGARLTAWELVQEGIPGTLIADGAAASLMARGMIDAVIVGADRIAANGDTANKIGTYMLACCAARHEIPFYVAAPSGTFDLNTASGIQIPIEERVGEELLHLAGQRTAAIGIEALNPVFDVTPAALIAAIVCEKGVIRPVSRSSVERVLGLS